VFVIPEYDIRVYSHPDQLSPQWPAAGTATDARQYIFQTTTFLQTWLASYGTRPGNRLCLVEVWDLSGNPLCFLPFSLSSRHGGRVLTFVDDGVADYNAPILFPNGDEWTRTSAEQLWNRIAKALPPFDMAIFDKMPEQIRDRTNPLFLLAEDLNGESCHLTNLKRSWPEVDQSQPGSKNLRNRHRALERLGECRLLIAGTPEERAFVLETLLAQKQRRFEETQVPGFDKEPEKQSFFTLGTDNFAAANALHLSALVVNGQVIAAMWGLVEGRHYYGLVFTFESGEWSKYSPGRVLHYLLLRHLLDSGYDCLDLGIGDEPWKLNCCDVTIDLKKMTLVRTARGRIIATRLRVMERLRATPLWQKLRPLKWKVLRALR